MSYDQARRQYLEHGHARQDRLADIAVQVRRAPWRVFRNRCLRHEVARLQAEDDVEYAALKAWRQPHGEE